MNNKKPDVGILVFTDYATLHHKQNDGYKEYGDYVFWYGSRVPKRIIELLPNRNNLDSKSYPSEKLLTNIFEDNAIQVKDLDIRIYFQVDGEIKGYFKITAVLHSHKSYELRFFSDDWVEEINEGKRGHQGWEYYPK